MVVASACGLLLVPGVAGTASAASLTCTSRQATAMPASANVFVVGDSLTYGEWCYIRSAPADYQARGLIARVDGKVARSTVIGVRLVTDLGAALPRQLVFALGTNDLFGGVTPLAFRAALEQAVLAAGPTRQVLIPTVFGVGRETLSAAFNAQIAKAAAVHPNVVVIAWAAWIAVRKHLLAGDGVHLSPTGYRARSAFISNVVTQSTALGFTRARTLPLAFEPVDRVRFADSRNGLGMTTLLPGVPQRVQIGARQSVPAAARAVRLDITATGASRSGAVAVLPCGTRPSVWSVNFPAGSVAASSVVATALDPYGGVCLLATVAADVVIDVTGWFGDGATLRYTPVPPVRLIATSAAPDAVPTLTTRVELADAVAAAPVTGVRAAEVVLGVTAPEQLEVSLHACDYSAPAVPDLEVQAGTTVAIATHVLLGAGTAICMTSSAPAFVSVDLLGWYATDGGLRFQALAPIRLVDTRARAGWLSNGLKGSPLAADTPFDVSVAGVRGVPSTGTVLAGHLTVFGQAAPGVFSVGADGTQGALAPLHVGIRDNVAGFFSLSSGHLVVRTSTSVHVAIDVTGVWR